MIETREDLAAALTAAAELEHGLLLQYLFAAYSMKKTSAEGIRPAQTDLVRDWEAKLLAVARDEMIHLGTVCNLLAAIGEAPQFRRRNFPQPAGPTSVFDFELARYSDEALYRFVRAEQPAGHGRPVRPAGSTPLSDSAVHAAEPILYDTTGELYEKIELAFFTVPNAIIGPEVAQDTADWGTRLKIPIITTVEQAVDAMRNIVRQGEGSPGEIRPSHYEMFVALRTAFAEQPVPFEPARPVARNPRVSAHLPDAPEGTLIVDAVTRDVATLFNDVYETVLLMLMQYYSASGETPAQLGGLRDAIRFSMNMTVRPIAEVLTYLPMGNGTSETAGPTFELTTDLRLSTQLRNRWTVLYERFARNAATAKRIASSGAAGIQRLTFVAESIALIAAKLQGVAP